ncbi:tetratricopeptide repeat protein [Williamwhitmania taraxaci]|uniref:Tetratricopeptide repeat-containing protein n=1 Tax=Williamwhitmania taraxaci TaxID=1640674 RepID=A0A1G6NWX4_9BACT|nr:tetratricopeptide repeat protein [Williamwhitmania taraxaci]SDC72141.1 Tetratricopeptide repeat-containing protein [Williamwhitmania taraxaci]
MERKRYIGLVVAFIFMVTSLSVRALEPTAVELYRCKLYNTYVEGNVSQWVRFLPEMEKINATHPSSELLLEIARTRYGLVAFLINEKKGKGALVDLDKGLANVESLLIQNPKNAEAMALKASFLAFTVELRPFGAPINGPKSLRIIDLALNTAPMNAYVLIDKANAKQFTPYIFGGDLEEAVGFYLKSIAAFEKMDPNQCRWVYVNALANLGTCYYKLDEYAKAEAIYKKALVIAPEFDWVKMHLLPEVQAKLKKK